MNTNNMISRISKIAVLMLASLFAPAALSQDAPSFPGGASSLQERFQDWGVSCQVVEATKRCVVSQSRVQQNGQRLMAIELVPGPDNTVTGVLALPFGLLLDAGIALQVDDQPAMPPLRIHTCLPVGCVVDLDLDGGAVMALRQGAALTVAARAADTGEDFAIALSLSGYSSALDRARTLMEN